MRVAFYPNLTGSVCRKTNPQEWERLKPPQAPCHGFALLAVSQCAFD
jgi:hypothetical protein